MLRHIPQRWNRGVRLSEEFDAVYRTYQQMTRKLIPFVLNEWCGLRSIAQLDQGIYCSMKPLYSVPEYLWLAGILLVLSQIDCDTFPKSSGIVC